MFHGETAINLDAKGRLAIPTRYRDDVAAMSDSRLVVTVNPFDKNHTLWLYPLGEWERVQRQVMSLSTTKEKHRWVQRAMVGSASQCDMDGNGRILLPTPLREFAKLDKRVTLLGLGHRFEIWDETQWREHRERNLQEGIESDPDLSLELDGLAL